MKPFIFKVESTEEIGINFLYWLADVYSRKRCYSVRPKELKLLKKNFDESIVPYVAIDGEILEEEVNQTKRVLKKAVGEYFGSMNEKNRKVDFIEIKNPENDEEFQNFILHMLVKVGGNPYCNEKQRKMLPEYVSWFCLNSKAVKTLAGQIVMDQKKIKSLNNTIGYDD